MPIISGEQEDGNECFADAVVDYVGTAFNAYKTQLLLLPKDHIDFATTYCDLAQGLESLLAEAKARLFASFPQWNSMAKAGKFQHFCQSNFERIRKLYED